MAPFTSSPTNQPQDTAPTSPAESLPSHFPPVARSPTHIREATTASIARMARRWVSIGKRPTALRRGNTVPRVQTRVGRLRSQTRSALGDGCQPLLQYLHGGTGQNGAARIRDQAVDLPGACCAHTGVGPGTAVIAARRTIEYRTVRMAQNLAVSICGAMTIARRIGGQETL